MGAFGFVVQGVLNKTFSCPEICSDRSDSFRMQSELNSA